MEDLLSIKVNIANRQYPLRIERREEESVRKAAKKINDRIREYEKNYSVRDGQDLLAMCALHFANESASAKTSKSSEFEKLKDKAAEVDTLISYYLNSL